MPTALGCSQSLPFVVLSKIHRHFTVYSYRTSLEDYFSNLSAIRRLLVLSVLGMPQRSVGWAHSIDAALSQLY